MQCRGCEPACPSGVPFGRLMEGTRDTLAGEHRMTPAVAARRVPGARPPSHAARRQHRARQLRSGCGSCPSAPASAGCRCAAARSCAATGDDVWLFTGCVMDAWLRDTHRATATVLDAIGTTYRTPEAGGDCCGALHIHAGLTPRRPGARPAGDGLDARRRADRRQLRRLRGGHEGLRPPAGHPGGAGVQRPGGRRARVRRHAGRPPPSHAAASAPVVVQDPCHLRHVQRAQAPVRTVLGAVADIVELDDDGLCCGAGGAYSALQPELAGEIRERKLAALERAGGGPEVGSWPAPTPAARCTSPRPASPCATRWISWPRRCGEQGVTSYDHLAERVDAIVEELDELQFDALREASADGRGRPPDDKRLTQARRALEKAAHLLRGPDDPRRLTASGRRLDERVDRVDQRAAGRRSRAWRSAGRCAAAPPSRARAPRARAARWPRSCRWRTGSRTAR